MNSVIPFSYIERASFLHRLDPRCKFFAVCLISLSLLSAETIFLWFYLILILLLMKNSGLKLMPTLLALRYFLFLLSVIFAVRMITTPGEALFTLFHISFTRQGISLGFDTAFKFFLLMLTGLLLAVTTRPSAVKSAVQWFLKPVPFIPEKRAAVIISLALNFIPILMKQAKNISDARKARCADLIKNPVRNIIGTAMPLLRKSFLSADRLVLAMEARCYSDDRTDPGFTPSGREPLFLSAACLIFLISVLL